MDFSGSIDRNTFSVVPSIINGAIPLTHKNGDTTLSIMTISITTLSITTISITILSITFK